MAYNFDSGSAQNQSYIYFESADCVGTPLLPGTYFMNIAVFNYADFSLTSARAYRATGAPSYTANIGSRLTDTGCLAEGNTFTSAVPARYVGTYPREGFTLPFSIR